MTIRATDLSIRYLVLTVFNHTWHNMYMLRNPHKNRSTQEPIHGSVPTKLANPEPMQDGRTRARPEEHLL